jgi:hypothetical protein
VEAATRSMASGLGSHGIALVFLVRDGCHGCDSGWLYGAQHWCQ